MVTRRENIRFENFTGLNEMSLIKILSWRNHNRTRSQMRSTEIIGKEDHILFVKNLKNLKKSHYWLASGESIKIGVVYLHINKSKKEAEWGYYLAPKFIGSGIGLELAYESICMFFENFDINMVHGYVKPTNKQAGKIQEILNFEKQNKFVDNLLHYVMDAENFNQLPKTYREFKKSLLRKIK